LVWRQALALRASLWTVFDEVTLLKAQVTQIGGGRLAPLLLLVVVAKFVVNVVNVVAVQM